MLLDNSSDDNLYEYLIINTENNNFYRKNMLCERAKRFSKILEATPIAPIELIGTDYTEVTADEFDYPLPF